MRTAIFMCIAIFLSYGDCLATEPLLVPWTHHNQEEYEAGVTKESHSGLYSAFIKSRNLDKITGGSLWQCIKPPVEWIGERVRMTAFLKTKD